MVAGDGEPGALGSPVDQLDRLRRGEGLERVEDLAEERPHLPRMGADREVPRLDRREVQQIADQAVHPIPGPLDRLDLPAGAPLFPRRLGRQRALEQERARRQHDAQRIAQVVRDDRQEILARAPTPAPRRAAARCRWRSTRAAPAPARRPDRQGRSAALHRARRAPARPPTVPAGAAARPSRIGPAHFRASAAHWSEPPGRRAGCRSDRVRRSPRRRRWKSRRARRRRRPRRAPRLSRDGAPPRSDRRPCGRPAPPAPREPPADPSMRRARCWRLPGSAATPDRAARRSRRA